MAPSPLPEEFTTDELDLLVDLAEQAIVEALAGRSPSPPSLEDLPVRLHRPGGVFVTLTVAGQLNGCIGAVEGHEPIGQAVVQLGCAAAFADPRLPALRHSDLGELTIEISLLGAPTPLSVGSWAHLVREIRPGHDGVILRAGHRQGLFLPTVWEQLPDPRDFLDQLYRKAGLVPRSWPVGMEALRFDAFKHSRPPHTRTAA